MRDTTAIDQITASDFDCFVDAACSESVLVFVNGLYCQQLSRFNQHHFPGLLLYPSLKLSEKLDGVFADVEKYTAQVMHEYPESNELPRDEYGSKSLLGLNLVRIIF